MLIIMISWHSCTDRAQWSAQCAAQSSGVAATLAGHSAEQHSRYLLPDRYVRGTRTTGTTGSFPDGKYRWPLNRSTIFPLLVWTIVAEWFWLVAVLAWKRTTPYAHAVRVPERNKPANTTLAYRYCAGMPPSVQAAKPGPRRGAVQPAQR